MTHRVQPQPLDGARATPACVSGDRVSIRDRVADEQGSTLPLVMVYAFIALVLILIVTAATSLYIERKRLFSVADATALVAAESFDLAAVGAAGSPSLTDASVLATSRDYLAGNTESRFEAFQLDEASTRDGRSATVVLSAMWRPPVLGPLLPEGLRISVTATARTAFW